MVDEAHRLKNDESALYKVRPALRMLRVCAGLLDGVVAVCRAGRGFLDRGCAVPLLHPEFEAPFPPKLTPQCGPACPSPCPRPCPSPCPLRLSPAPAPFACLLSCPLRLPLPLPPSPAPAPAPAGAYPVELQEQAAGDGDPPAEQHPRAVGPAPLPAPRQVPRQVREREGAVWRVGRGAWSLLCGCGWLGGWVGVLAGRAGGWLSGGVAGAAGCAVRACSPPQPSPALLPSLLPASFSCCPAHSTLAWAHFPPCSEAFEAEYDMQDPEQVGTLTRMSTLNRTADRKHAAHIACKACSECLPTPTTE